METTPAPLMVRPRTWGPAVLAALFALGAVRASNTGAAENGESSSSAVRTLLSAGGPRGLSLLQPTQGAAASQPFPARPHAQTQGLHARQCIHLLCYGCAGCCADSDASSADSDARHPPEHAGAALDADAWADIVVIPIDFTLDERGNVRLAYRLSDDESGRDGSDDSPP